MRMTQRCSLAVLIVAGAVLLAGCGGDGAGPNQAAIDDPQGLQADLDGLAGSLTAGPMVGVANVSSLGYGGLSDLSHGRLVSQGDVIDDSRYGTRFDLDPNTQIYGDDGSGLGPVDGVAFVLYDVEYDANDNIILGPPIGMLNVRDRSDQAKSEVGIQVIGTGGSPVTYADYAVALPDTWDSGHEGFDLRSSGVLSNGTEDTSFDLHVVETLPPGILERSVTLGLDGLSASLDLEFELRVDAAGFHIAVDLLLMSRGEPLRLSGTQDFQPGSDDFTTNLRLTADGITFATATTDNGTGQPVWEKPNGDPLTPDEQSLLEAMYRGGLGAGIGAFDLVFFTLEMVT